MKKYIPTLFTLTNLCCGVLAVMLGQLWLSSVFIFAGLICDVFDGFSARLLNAQSELGKQLDSLSDLITFGLAPAYLYFLLAPDTHWQYFIGPLVLVMCSSLRLGKFNTLPSSKYFIGLPTPATAIFFLGIFFAADDNNTLVSNLISHPIIYTLIPIVIGLLMISRMTMFSLKGLGKQVSSYLPLVILVILTLLLAIFNWRLAFSGLVLLYILISLLTTPLRKEDLDIE